MISRRMANRRWGSTIHKSEFNQPLLSKHVSPNRELNNTAIRKLKNPLRSSHALSDEMNEKVETLKTVEHQIKQKWSETAQNQSLKRFKQLQEYLKIGHRDVKINQNVRNETKRLVKGEIPLGTDTQIKHEIRENYPKILEIKRRLKNWLSIDCSFDEVIKYAKQYFGIDTDDESLKHAMLKEHKKLKRIQEFDKNENSVKIFKKPLKFLQEDNKPDDDTRSMAILPKDDNKDVEQEEWLLQDEDEKTNISFTRKKWSNIDELIEVLQEEIHESSPNKN